MAFNDDFDSEDFDLHEWLNTQPAEVSVAIAARAALRVFPLSFELNVMADNAADEHLLFFRAMELLFAVSKYPIWYDETNVLPPEKIIARNLLNTIGEKQSTRQPEFKPNRAAKVFQYALAAFVTSGQEAKGRTVLSATAAAGILPKFRIPVVDGVGEVLLSGDGNVLTSTGLDGSRDDSEVIGNGANIWNLPLWLKSNWPFASRWEACRHELLFPRGVMPFLANWYEDRLAGRNTAGLPDHLAEELDLKIALQPDEWWKQDPSKVNADIEGWVAELRLRSAQDYAKGTAWKEADDERLVAHTFVFDGDIDVARHPVTQQLHDGIRRRVGEFRDVAISIENNLGWDDISASCERLHTVILFETQQVPENLGSIYDCSVDFAKFVEQDNWLRNEGSGNLSALDPVSRRKLEGIVEVLAPWLRRFPTAQQLDDELGSFLGKIPDKLLSIQLANGAQASGLISEEDRKLLQSLLKEIKGAGPIVAKAGIRGDHSIRNLTLTVAAVVLTFYSGAIASDFSSKSQLVAHASDFLVKNENAVLKHFKGSATDIQQAIKSVIEKSKREGGVQADDLVAIESQRKRNGKPDSD